MLAGLAAIVLMVPAILRWQHFRPSAALGTPSSNSSAEILASVARNWPPQREARNIYPYSVVPGGVVNAAELKQAAEHDPVVASHYAGFEYQHARAVRLKTAALMYVSYRKNGRVYWTRKAHLIPAGEKVITDGKATARARCGNQLSDRPHAATAPSEPSEEALSRPTTMADSMAVDLPPLSDLHSALLPPDPGRELSGGGLLSSPVGVGGIFPPVGLMPPAGGGTPVVPEPGTMILVGSGLAAVYALRKKRS